MDKAQKHSTCDLEKRYDELMNQTYSLADLVFGTTQRGWNVCGKAGGKCKKGDKHGPTSGVHPQSGHVVKQLHVKNIRCMYEFFWVEYIGEACAGTNRIIEWCREWGLAEPDFEFTGTRLIVTLWKSKVTDRYLDSLGLNERQRKAIDYMREHKRITSRTYANLFKITEFS